ncbi:MAG: glycosyltransferase family 39 protein [Anaerolineales bacterium]|nr:glycosyltransferase family 39 protein [Anaerolineales bacterium]
MTRRLKSAILPLCLLWLFAILAAYYWGQQARLVLAAFAVIRILWQAVALGLIGLTSYGVGAVLTRRLKLDFVNKAEQLVTNLGLGQLVLSLLILLLSLMGALNSGLFWLLGLAGAGGTGVWLWRRRQPAPAMRLPAPLPWTTWEKIYIAALAVNISVGLLLALAPPVGWDGLSTHLVLVREALRSGTLLQTSVFQRPLAGHLYFIWGFALGGDSLPQLISYSQALLSLVAVWAVARHYFDRATALLAIVILSAVEVYFLTAAWPYADMPTAWFALLATLSFLRWAEDETNDSRGWLILSALFAAMTFGSKINGLFLLLPLLTGVGLVLWWRREHWRAQLPGLVLSLVSGGLLCGVWLWLERWLRPAGITTLTRVNDALPTPAADVDLLGKFVGYLRLPFEMTVLGQQGLQIFDGRITPLFLILIPILIFLPRKPRVVQFLLLFAGLELAGWILIPQNYYQTRHLMLAFPLFSLLAAYTLGRMSELDTSWFTLSGFWRVIMVLVLAIQAIFYLDWLTFYDPLPYVLGFQGRDEYLAQNLNSGTASGYYDMMLAIRDLVEPEAMVGFIRPEPRTFYCAPVRCERLDLYPAVAGDLEGFLATQQEFDYLLVSWEGIRYFQDFYAPEPTRQAGWERLELVVSGYLAEHGELIHETGGFSLYHVER